MKLIQCALSSGALALAVALWGCSAMQSPKGGANQETFLSNDERCTRLALRAAPLLEPRVVPCNSDGSYMNCSIRSAFTSTIARPTPAEREAMRQASRLRKRAYAECMAESGMDSPTGSPVR